MIDEVAIRNFQSLASVRVELGTLTIIVGPNDLGKSAFIRAVRSAVEAASGTHFITRGSTQTKVALRFDDHTLIWVKGANVNQYHLDKKVFDRIGRQVPEEVTELLAMGRASFDSGLDLNLNFADQDDPPFLIPFPGGMNEAHVAKILGDLTNLSLLFRATQQANREISKASAAATLAQDRARDLGYQLREFDGLEGRVLQAASARAVYTQALEAQTKLNRLLGYKDDRDRLRDVRQTILEKETTLLDVAKLELILGRATGVATRIGQLEQVRDTSSRSKNRLEELDQQIVEAERRLDEANARLEAFLDELDVCPVCSRPMDREHAAVHS